MSKFDLFRCNIFTEHLITVRTRQEHQNLVTKHAWPKIEHRMRNMQCQSHNFIHTHFMDMLKLNKKMYYTPHIKMNSSSQMIQLLILEELVKKQ